MQYTLDRESEVVRAFIEAQIDFSETNSESASGSNNTEKQQNGDHRLEEALKVSFG